MTSTAGVFFPGFFSFETQSSDLVGEGPWEKTRQSEPLHMNPAPMTEVRVPSVSTLPFGFKLAVAFVWTFSCVLGGWVLFCENENAEDLQSIGTNQIFRVSVSEMPSQGPGLETSEIKDQFTIESNFEKKILKLEKMAHTMDKIDIVLACAFGFGRDPQRGKTLTDAISYSKGWRESVLKIEDLHAVLITDLLSPSEIDEISHERLEVVSFDPSSSEMINASSHLSVNDFVYIAAQAWIVENSERLRYFLITDLHDVVFNDNPFHYMMSIDMHFSSHLLFVQDESGNIPGAFRWLTDVWTRCGMEREKIPRGTSFFSSGLVGGHLDVFLPFLKKYCEELLQKPPKKNCNMAVMQRMITGDYKTLVVHGWPFHNIFGSKLEDKLSIVKHK